MSLVVDTSFLVDVARGDAGANALLTELEQARELLLIPTVVVAEYLAGSRDPAADLDELERAGDIVALTVEDARAAGEIAREALAAGRFPAGRFPAWSDALIAGVARARSASLVVTSNPRHFDVIEGVETLTY